MFAFLFCFPVIFHFAEICVFFPHFQCLLLIFIFLWFFTLNGLLNFFAFVPCNFECVYSTVLYSVLSEMLCLRVLYKMYVDILHFLGRFSCSRVSCLMPIFIILSLPWGHGCIPYDVYNLDFYAIGFRFVAWRSLSNEELELLLAKRAAIVDPLF